MNKTQNFQGLIVWQKAHKLVLSVYDLTKDFPKHEIYGLVSQMRRSSVSVAANIAEGYRKRGLLDKVRFLNIAEGSLDELQYYLVLTRDLKYLNDNYEELMKLVNEVSKLLNAYSNAIKVKHNSKTPVS